MRPLPSKIPSRYIDRASRMDWAPGISVEAGARYLMESDRAKSLLGHAYPSKKRTSRNPAVDTKLYSVVDRMTGFERRHLTREQAKLTLDAHAERCARHGWRHEARVYYRDGTDVTREFRDGSMSGNARLTEAQRSKLPLSVFVFPERRAFPLESEAAAYDAIRMLRLGRVKSASDFKAVTDAIRAEYPAVWKKYGAGLSWPKTKAAKALGSKRRAATVAKKKRTSRMAANERGTTFPGTLSGYHAAHGWLVQHGFHPVPGSSRYEDSMRRTGRILDEGPVYRVEIQSKLGRNPTSVAEVAPWRVRDRLTRHRYYFDSRSEAERFIDTVSTSEITGEPLREWADRLVAEKNV